MPDAPVLVWFRRDLRLADHPALAAAAAGGRPVLGVFVLDDALALAAAQPRGRWVLACVADLRARSGGGVVVRRGTPEQVLVALAGEVGATEVHATAEATPWGADRDRRVADALAAAGVGLAWSGTPYAVDPGVVTKADGSPYSVFTPFKKAWERHAPGGPVAVPEPRWRTGVASDPLPDVGPPPAWLIPGEAAAVDRLRTFVAGDLAGYAEHRNRPDLDATSRLSPAFKAGCIHPRTVLEAAAAGGSRASGATDRDAEVFRSEVVWREFYGDVLFHRPRSAWETWNATLARLEVDTGADAEARFERWCAGETGYPLVDAGMRQLAAEAWMHNRVRMVAASFLVKDLHLPWQWGARWFLEHLADADVASNNHGWQWAAGTGTDAAPYVRVFNPVTQAKRFDPDGAYVARWVPELAPLTSGERFEPWERRGGPPLGYPPPMVDHAAERDEALRRFAALTPPEPA